ncbi:hypothetical protein [Streptomyces radiopugnans]|uniref:hypothetical protein n=1 Tax=Streptomyces radiopugnans TaxID=403935 RepID=UPI003F1CA39B
MYAIEEEEFLVQIRTGAASAALAVLLAAVSAMPAQADEPIEQPGTSLEETYQDETASSPVNVFVTRGDNVHFSRDVPGTINAHGWWTKTSGPATSAKVTIWLQVRSGSLWRNLDTGVKTVGPGGGRGKRANASWECTNLIARNDFRSVVDVDIVGYADGDSKLTTPTQSLYCGV